MLVVAGCRLLAREICHLPLCLHGRESLSRHLSLAKERHMAASPCDTIVQRSRFSATCPFGQIQPTYGVSFGPKQGVSDSICSCGDNAFAPKNWTEKGVRGRRWPRMQPPIVKRRYVVIRVGQMTIYFHAISLFRMVEKPFPSLRIL